MAITSDGTQAFGLEDSPVTINSVTYILESATYTQTSTRADVNSSDGEPLGSTVIPGRIEGSATLQLATATTAVPAIGQTFTIASGRNDGTYVLTDVGESQSQGEYVKVNISFYKQLN